MPKLISFIIPSRRSARVMDSVVSIINTAKDPDCVDIWIKIDCDDAPSVAQVPKLIAVGRVNVLIGPRLEGYGSLNFFCSKIAGMTDAKWVCFFNDDAVIEGIGWDEKLAQIQCDAIVHAEIHQLNSSKYLRDDRSAFPIVPNGFWAVEGAIIPTPCDAYLVEIAKRLKLPTMFLAGITFRHNWTGTL